MIKIKSKGCSWCLDSSTCLLNCISTINFCALCSNSTTCIKCNNTYFLASNASACITDCSLDMGSL